MVDSYRRRSARLGALLGQVLREQSSEQVGLAASGAAFWLVIAIFPTLIAAVSLYGLVVTPQRVADNLAGLAHAGPQSLGATLAQQLEKVAATDHAGLTVGLIVSVLLAFWSASAGVYSLERAIRAAYGFIPERYVRARVRALVGTAVIVFSVGLAASISATAAIAAEHLPRLVTIVIAVPVSIAALTAVIAALYRYSVDHRLALGQQLPGAATAVSASVSSQPAFRSTYDSPPITRPCTERSPER